MTDYKVAVFGSAGPRGPKAQLQLENARKFGRLLAIHKMQLAQGGGPGVMKALREGHRLDGGMPESIHLNKHVPESEEGELVQGYDILSDRQYKLLRERNAFVALDGGVGSAYEILQVASCKTLGEIALLCPMICVGECWKYLEILILTMSQDYGTLQFKPSELVTFVPDINLAMEVLLEDRQRLRNIALQ